MSDMTTYPIALDPALDIDSAALAAAWNANPDLAAHGLLTTQAEATKGFDLATMGLAFVGSIAGGLLTNYLYDLIVRGTFAIKADAVPPTIREFTQPDGTKIIIIAKD